MDNAQIIKLLRKENGLNQQTLASLLNVSLSTVKSWEQGQREPSGPVVRLLQLILRDETIVNQLRKFSEDKLMFDLNVDEKAQTIMGVHFDSYTTFRATLNAIASNMYEGFVPNIDDVKWAASGASVPTPEQILAEVRKEDEEEELAKQPRMG